MGFSEDGPASLADRGPSSFSVLVFAAGENAVKATKKPAAAPVRERGPVLWIVKKIHQELRASRLLFEISRRAGLLADGSDLLAAPSRAKTPSGFLRLSSPITVAGPQRILTAFPLRPIIGASSVCMKSTRTYTPNSHRWSRFFTVGCFRNGFPACLESIRGV